MKLLFTVFLQYSFQHKYKSILICNSELIRFFKPIIKTIIKICFSVPLLDLISSNNSIKQPVIPDTDSAITIGFSINASVDGTAMNLHLLIFGLLLSVFNYNSCLIAITIHKHIIKSICIFFSFFFSCSSHFHHSNLCFIIKFT